MKIATIVARVLLGLAFVVFGLNAFLQFLHMPPPPKGPAGDFMMALFTSHYYYVVALLQICGGALLVIGRFVPLGLTLLAPVMVNILLYHIFLNPEGIGLALIFAAVLLFLLARYWNAFAGLVKP